MNDTPQTPSCLPQTAKMAMHELLRYGWLEAEQKPETYRQLLTWLESVNDALSPLDLHARIDDTRGVAWLSIAQEQQNEDDEWTHSLVRRQRLTLEHSLLLAILRQIFIDGEQSHGIGEPVWADIDDIQAQLALYLKHSGSESKDEKQLRTLLEALRKHGVVSEINDNGQVRIRPLIAHLASPQTLVRLLEQYQNLAQTTLHQADEGTAHD